MTTTGTHDRDERGTGLVATMIAVPLVLVLLLFATQVLIRLQARSSLTAMAADAAREAALDAGPTATSAARAGRVLRAGLGPAGEDAAIEWRIDPHRIEVHVRVAAPRLLPGGPAGALSRPIEVVASARREAWQ